MCLRLKLGILPSHLQAFKLLASVTLSVCSIQGCCVVGVRFLQGPQWGLWFQCQPCCLLFCCDLPPPLGDSVPHLRHFQFMSYRVTRQASVLAPGTAERPIVTTLDSSSNEFTSPGNIHRFKHKSRNQWHKLNHLSAIFNKLHLVSNSVLITTFLSFQFPWASSCSHPQTLHTLFISFLPGLQRKIHTS